MRELKRLYPYLFHHKKKFIFGFLFVTISNICSTIIPRIIGSTIDVLAKGGIVTTWDIVPKIAIILLLTAGSGYFMFLTRRTIIVASRLIEYELRNDLLSTLERLPLRYFQNMPTGELMAHSTNDISAAREFIGPAIMYTANTLTTFLFALSMMLALSPEITLYSLLPLPIISYITYKIGRKVHVVFKDVQDQFARLTSWAQENMSGVRVVRAYVREAFEIHHFSLTSQSYLQKNIHLAKVQALSMPGMMLLVGISQVIVVGVGGGKVIRGEATLGDLTQFFLYLNQLVWPVIAIGWVTNIIQRAAASMGRLGRIFDEVAEIADNEQTDQSITHLQGNIEFKNVHFRYSPLHAEVLTDISLTIPAGTTVGIVGETGSGKSTIVNLIPRLFDSTAGELLIDGHPITSLPLKTLRRHIAVVPQESFLFSTSIADNIRFGHPQASLDEIVEASGIAQLHEDIGEFPDGYNTMVGERGITLSGGQKQRTAIARAIIARPSILIFDDSLSAVDTHTEERILQGLRNIMKGRTSILISHRVSTVQNADMIVVLKENRIEEQGTHEELIRQNGLYAEMYRRQLLEEEIEHM